MLQKASEILSQLSDIQEEIRKKKLSLQFNVCASCKVEIDFHHKVEAATPLMAAHVIEWGSCPVCQGQIKARRFMMQ